jgi:hypothetical protein
MTRDRALVVRQSWIKSLADPLDKRPRSRTGTARVMTTAAALVRGTRMSGEGREADHMSGMTGIGIEIARKIGKGSSEV